MDMMRICFSKKKPLEIYIHLPAHVYPYTSILTPRRGNWTPTPWSARASLTLRINSLNTNHLLVTSHVYQRTFHKPKPAESKPMPEPWHQAEHKMSIHAACWSRPPHNWRETISWKPTEWTEKYTNIWRFIGGFYFGGRSAQH